MNDGMPQPLDNLLLLPELFPLEPAQWQRVLSRCQMSARQTKVAELLLYGLTDKQIAAIMRRSGPTVRTHFSRLFFKSSTDVRHALAMRLVCAARTDIPFVPWR